MNGIDELAQAARRVIGDTGPYSLYPLSSHAENRTWYVAHAGQRCLAKFPEHSGGLTISPALEYEVLRSAAATGIAPRPLGHDSATGIIFVEEIARCTTLCGQPQRAGVEISSVIQALRQLHSLRAPESLRHFDPLAFAKAYCANIKDAAAQQQLKDCEQLVAECADLLNGKSICHNDLHGGNLLVGTQLWLVDFEYAVQAAPIVDVASYLAYNDVDEATAMSFARSCLNQEVPFSCAQLQAVVSIHRNLGELWKMARSDNNAIS